MAISFAVSTSEYLKRVPLPLVVVPVPPGHGFETYRFQMATRSPLQACASRCEMFARAEICNGISRSSFQYFQNPIISRERQICSIRRK